MKTTIELNKSELTELLKTIEFGSLVDIHISTKVRMNKTNNPYFDLVTKHSNGVVFVGGNYKDRVEKSMDMEKGSFEPEKNRVGDHVSKCVLYNEKFDKHYLQYEMFRNRRMKTSFTFEGDPIGKQLFESYLVKSNPNKYGVQTQSVTVDNIKELTYRKTRYIVV